MKSKLILAAALLALTATASQACGGRLAARVRSHNGPVVNAVRHNVAAQPVRTVAGRVIEFPAKVVESRPLATWFGKATCAGTNCK